MDSIKKQIFQLENDLIKSEVRKSAEKINEILSNDFVEFSSSGSEYHYKCGDVFQDEEDERTLDWEILNFKVKKVAENCILATYRVIKHDELDERKRYSLRSSLWTEENGKWKMSFHQGTLLAGKEGRSIF
ncbi:DUF4440 domain-containing protein [Clostridium perfringens]|nr:DUF4440 domain-containing protein [Clostridium perfringens]EHA1007238.1 DUF4440 domain-containing protein [Clostridium perfringens]EHA1019227.1 DUF4440 domain-containing protein [Clostridium perfringens]